jgi:malonate-semialdehyde dehydrogenase (acetylating)/methylmalonate-semialdehyde dehydrogenase
MFFHLCSWSAILVGEAQSWLPELIERAQKLKVSGGFERGADL